MSLRSSLDDGNTRLEDSTYTPAYIEHRIYIYDIYMKIYLEYFKGCNDGVHNAVHYTLLNRRAATFRP